MNEELIKVITQKKYDWNLRRIKYSSTPSGFQFSPNKYWLIVYFLFHQDPEDRYESEIDDEEYILFGLNLENPEKEVGRFRYYYNYNSCADLKESVGSRFGWGEGEAILKLKNESIDLVNLSLTEIQKILGQYN